MQPILHVDLTDRKISTSDIPEEWEWDYLGAASLAARMLYDALGPELAPTDPEAPLLFLTGPLTGTAGPAVGRFVICAKSPATGLWGESNCGGFWGPELRKTGYDGLLVTGRAEEPVYLWIHDGNVEIREASHLWGMDTYETQTAVSREINLPNPRIAVIGPAGEHQVPMALILTDHGRVAGRTGMGAVMGSKNLKAVAVKGSGKIPLRTTPYVKIRSRTNRILREDNFSRAARETGTAGVADYLDYLGESPKQYFGRGTFEGVEQVTGATMAETILKGVSTCHACVIACGRVVQLSGENHQRKGPEYETIMGFGPNLMIDDLEFITRIGGLCDRYGIDVISLSNTVGLAFSLFQRGVITAKDTDGLALKWGDKGAVEELVNLVFERKGIGLLLAEGARALGRHFGAEEDAVQVNGLEAAYHDPRGSSGMGLIYATSPRGACHNQSDYFLVDIYGMVESRLGMTLFKRHDGAEKATNVVIHQNWRTVFNSLVMCYFANVSPKTIKELIDAATGRNYTLEDLLSVGERAWNLKRVINNRLGLNRKNDRLPKSLLKPFKEGGSSGYRVPFDEMLQAYYAVRGWDFDTGCPSDEKLAELGLDWAALSKG
jgi:aldehyde:ferredoxin oxidoreductase